MRLRCVERGGIQPIRLNQRVVLRRCVNIGADSRDCSFSRFELGDSEVRNLDCLAVGSQQKIRRLDVAVYDSALVRVREAVADLFEIKERAFDCERLVATTRGQFTAS